MWLDRLGFGGCAVAWQAARQGVGPFRVLALGGQWLGKLVASAWQARGKLVASDPFFLASARFTILGEAKTHAFLTFLVVGIPPKCPLCDIRKEKCRK